MKTDAPLLEHNVFHASLPQGRNGEQIVYAPLADMLFIADQRFTRELSLAFQGNSQDQQANEIADLIRQESRLPEFQAPMNFSYLTVLPTNLCNFNCSYCYSAKSRNTSRETISTQQLRRALELFIRKINPNETSISVTFYGGGEPLLAWDTILEAMDFLKQHVTQKVHVKIITNGSLLDEEKIRFLLQNKAELTISFELLEDMQNKYRGSFDKVSGVIRNCIRLGLVPEINAVITKDNVRRIQEMLDEAERSWPEIRYFHFEPVVSQDLFDSLRDYADFLKDFSDNFFAAQERLFMSPKELSCSFFTKMRKVSSRFCPVDFVITPHGDISSCPCVSSHRLPDYDFYLYSKGQESGPVLDQEKFARLRQLDNSSDSRCRTCLSRWNCAGGCLHRKRTMKEDYNQVFCHFMKDFTLRSLVMKLDVQYRKDYGKTLDEMLKQAGDNG